MSSKDHLLLVSSTPHVHSLYRLTSEHCVSVQAYENSGQRLDLKLLLVSIHKTKLRYIVVYINYKTAGIKITKKSFVSMKVKLQVFWVFFSCSGSWLNKVAIVSQW